MSGMADTAGEDLSKERQFLESTIFHPTRPVDSLGGDLLGLFSELRMKSQALSGSIVHL